MLPQRLTAWQLFRQSEHKLLNAKEKNIYIETFFGLNSSSNSLRDD